MRFTIICHGSIHNLSGSGPVNRLQCQTHDDCECHQDQLPERSNHTHISIGREQSYACLPVQNPGHLSAQLRSQKHLTEAFDKSLSGCRMTLDALNRGVIKLVEPNRDGGRGGIFEMGFRAKARLVWNEDVMKGLLDHTRGQITSLQFLISMLETCAPPSTSS